MTRTARSSAARRTGALAGAAALAVALASLASWAASKGNPAAAKKDGGTVVDGAAPPAKPDVVHISIQTVPPRKAQVKWGSKLLGVIPVPRALVIERPRDSGPLDLVLRASGFLPVHTRAYTFTDSRVAVKLTPPAEKNKLFGYREEPAPNPDGGAPEPATSTVPAPASVPAPAPTPAPVP